MQQALDKKQNAQARFSGWANEAMERGRDLLKLRVDIVRGHHRGVSRAVNGMNFSVGSDLSDDICVFADQVEAAHFTVSRKHPLASEIRITADGGAVTLVDGLRVEKGTWVETKLPAIVQAEDLSVEVKQGFNPMHVLKSGVFFAIVAMFSWAVADFMGGTVKTNLLSPANASVQQATLARDINVGTLRSSKSSMQAGNLGELLNDRIRAAGLAHRITISQQEGNVVVASGAVTQEDAAQWRSILQWSDSIGAGARLVNNVEKTTEDNATPSISSVWLEGGKAQMRLSDDSVVGVGDSFGDGWKVEHITHDGVEISRGGKQVKLTF